MNVFKRFGVSEEELSENYFAGPAFLPWARMGNLQKWGGPLLLSWIQKQSALQLQLLRRMRSLGMTPVLSAFAGFLPHWPSLPRTLCITVRFAFVTRTRTSPRSLSGGSTTVVTAALASTASSSSRCSLEQFGSAWIEEQANIYSSAQCDTYVQRGEAALQRPGVLAASAEAV